MRATTHSSRPAHQIQRHSFGCSIFVVGYQTRQEDYLGTRGRNRTERRLFALGEPGSGSVDDGLAAGLDHVAVTRDDTVVIPCLNSVG